MVRLNNHEFIRWLYPVVMHQPENATDIRPLSDSSCYPILTIYQNDKCKAYFELSVLNGIKFEILNEVLIIYESFQSYDPMTKGKIGVMQTHQGSFSAKKIIYAIYKSATSPSALNMQCTDLYIYIIWSSLDSTIFLLCCFNCHRK